MLSASSEAIAPSKINLHLSDSDYPPLSHFVTNTTKARNNPPCAPSQPSPDTSQQESVELTFGSLGSEASDFPMYPSTLPYTQVRDFAYSATQPMHYGPPPEPSNPPTPASERRLSDPPDSWEQKMPWDSWTADGFNRGHDIPPIQFGDGPPYSEDEDLQSPVVATRHRKHKSSSGALGLERGRSRGSAERQGSGTFNMNRNDGENSYFMDTGRGGRERFSLSRAEEAMGSGVNHVTYPSDQLRHTRAHRVSETRRDRGDDSDSPSSPDFRGNDQSRYSRDYQFTITSPDEEFHGKAVALYDFASENENELSLVEGQIIWVSYRHGQGWLVAEDPKTEESGLVPEEYVRLLRDIEGGMNSLTGQPGDAPVSPVDAGTPTQAEHPPAQGAASNGYHQPVVSSFSTSSKDLNPYPTDQLHMGHHPPQVVPYSSQRRGSQMNTPTASHPDGELFLRRESIDTVGKGVSQARSPDQEDQAK